MVNFSQEIPIRGVISIANVGENKNIHIRINTSWNLRISLVIVNLNIL